MKNILILAACIIAFKASSQDKTNKKESNYKFTVVKNLSSTDVQNQNQTSTCWSFSSLSFFESEMIRLGKGSDFNLSEMFVVRKAYSMKADNYVRMHGKTNFGEGGGFPDVVAVMKKEGIVPEAVYTGKKDTAMPHNHHLLETTLFNILRPAAQDETQKIDFDFIHQSVNSVCDLYLGKTPETFEYKGKTYTPMTYLEATGINPNDYVFISSFTHHPFYSSFVLEVPDNWNWQTVYNIPLDEFKGLMEGAIMNGYTFAWAADVSEKTFLRADALALWPEKPYQKMSDDERKNMSTQPVPQVNVTQAMRQKAFDNYETQDDHGMHVIGIVKDQNNTMYYVVKNSWGKSVNECGGIFYASEAYVLMKTTSIMIHKKALPAALAKKLGIQQ